MLESLIAELRSSVDGELSARSQIVDHLLDLRLAARPNPSVVAVVDELLADLPGRTTVPNGWWLGGLADIERSFRSLPVAAVQSATEANSESTPESTTGSTLSSSIPGTGTLPVAGFDSDSQVADVPPPLPRRTRPE